LNAKFLGKRLEIASPRAAVLSFVFAILIVVLLWLLKPYDVSMPVQVGNSTVPWWLNP
jgi:hypothetical protein